MRTVFFGALVGLLAVFVTSAQADVVVNYAYTHAQVYQSAPYSFVGNGSSSLAGDTVNASQPGFSSTTSSLFGNSGFSTTFDQSRLGGQDDYSHGYAYSNFTAGSNEPYSISGSFTNSAGYTYLYAHLYDYSAGYIFYNYQTNYGGTTLTLGNTAGNNANSLFGSLMGNLVAGHQYQWYSVAYSQAGPGADGGATASGSTNLQLNAAVPEPASMLAWGLIAGVGAVGYRLRKRKFDFCQLRPKIYR